MTAVTDEQHVWPPSLRIRDTGLYDDMGGGGQRIYTTAGRGYETRVYVLAESPVPSDAVQVRGLRQICYHEGCQFEATQQENKRLRARITELENALSSVRQNVQNALKVIR